MTLNDFRITRNKSIEQPKKEKSNQWCHFGDMNGYSNLLDKILTGRLLELGVVEAKEAFEQRF